MATVDPAAVLSQLDRIVASPIFRGSPRLCAFLRFIVHQTLSGDAEGDAARYQPAADPIVRVEAARLRSKLREYYEGVGSGDPVRIEVPTGSYAPRFTAPANPAAPLPDQPAQKRLFIAVIPSTAPDTLRSISFRPVAAKPLWPKRGVDTQFPVERNADYHSRIDAF